MAFLVAGVVVFGWVTDVAVTDHQIRVIAEVTLVIVLFHDASSVRLRSLRHHPGLPLRLLLIGFPLALVFTFGRFRAGFYPRAAKPLGIRFGRRTTSRLQ